MHTIKALKYLVQEFDSSSKRVLEYSRNRSATGLHRERILEGYIKKIIPQSFSTGTGFIYGPEQSSNQIDIIIWDHSNYGPIYNEGGFQIVIPNSVSQIFEVKSRLTNRTLIDGFENIKSARVLNENIRGFIFGYSGFSAKIAIDYIEKYIKNLPDQRNLINVLPFMIICLGKWVLMGVEDEKNFNYIYFYKKSFEEQFLFFISSIYYFAYSKRIQLLGENKLPSLEDQGFITQYGPEDFIKLSISKI